MIFRNTVILTFSMQLSYYLIVKATQWWEYVLYCQVKLCLVKSFFMILKQIQSEQKGHQPMVFILKFIFYSVIHQD